MAAPFVRGWGYAGSKLKDALRRISKWTIEIIKRSDAAKGFEVLPRRWVVERTIAWLNRNRRLAKDFAAHWESLIGLNSRAATTSVHAERQRGA